jgi:ABC-type transport system involved in cytochrome c biogenesis permease subunit
MLHLILRGAAIHHLFFAFGWRSSSPPWFLLLGGAAVHRCDNRIIFRAGFSR